MKQFTRVRVNYGIMVVTIPQGVWKEHTDFPLKGGDLIRVSYDKNKVVLEVVAHV